jgi:hypothetical protein
MWRFPPEIPPEMWMPGMPEHRLPTSLSTDRRLDGRTVSHGGIASLGAGIASTRSSPKIEHFQVRRGSPRIANLTFLGIPAIQDLSVSAFRVPKTLRSLPENNHEHDVVSNSFEELVLVDGWNVARIPLGSGSGEVPRYFQWEGGA